MSEEQNQVELVHCIYASASTVSFTKDEITELLAIAQRNNGALGVTGMLLYEDGSFFQVLEGEKDNVSALFKKIALDKRHSKVIKIIQEPIQERAFSNWTMGYSGITRYELSAIDGLNDFFTSKQCYTDLDQGRTKKLLDAFKNGKWRSSIK